MSGSARADRPSRLTTHTRITLATFAPLLFFVVLGVVVGAILYPRILRELILQRQTALAQIAATGVAGEMQGHLRLLQNTADELGTLSGAAGATASTAQRQALARRALLETFTGGVVLLDLEGTVVAATPGSEPSLGLTYGSRDYFRRVVDGQAPVFSAALRADPVEGARAEVGTGGPNPTAQEPDVVVIAVPVRTQGRLAGVLAGKFDLHHNTWARNLNLLRTPQGGRAYLIDSASTIIYHPELDRIGSTVQAADPVLWQLVIGGEPVSRIHRSADGTAPSVTAYAPVPGLAWGVIMEEPWDAITAEARFSIWALAALLGVGILVAVALLWVTVRRALRPLDGVVAEARSVTAGGAFRPLPETGPADIRALIAALNLMVAKLDMHQAALRDYARRVLQSQEDERKRISRDLHDETVQALVGLNQRLELLGRTLDQVPAGDGAGAISLDAAARRLDEVRALASDTLSEVRRMSTNLRPFILEDLGLAAALQALTRELATELPAAHVTGEIVGEERRLPPEIELTAFRIVQEALTNVRKHAGPTVSRVTVALIYEAWGILILVEDDGPGIDLPPVADLVRDGHLGIAGMVERAQLFGGTLDVISAPGEGTTVRLRLEA